MILVGEGGVKFRGGRGGSLGSSTFRPPLRAGTLGASCTVFLFFFFFLLFALERKFKKARVAVRQPG